MSAYPICSDCGEILQELVEVGAELCLKCQQMLAEDAEKEVKNERCL